MWEWGRDERDKAWQGERCLGNYVLVLVLVAGCWLLAARVPAVRGHTRIKSCIEARCGTKAEKAWTSRNPSLASAWP